MQAIDCTRRCASTQRPASEANEADLLEARCLQHYRTRCLATADQARYDLLDWLAWTDLEIDNIRAVLQRCIARDDLARGLDIAASLGYFWITRGTTESIRWLDQLLAAEDASPQTQVRACYLRGWLSLLAGRASGCPAWLARAVAAARDLASVLSSPRHCLSPRRPRTPRRPRGRAPPSTRRRHCRYELDDYLATIELLQAQAVHALFVGATEEAKDLSIGGRAPEPSGW